jgi:hypothetical protein
MACVARMGKDQDTDYRRAIRAKALSADFDCILIVRCVLIVLCAHAAALFDTCLFKHA